MITFTPAQVFALAGLLMISALVGLINTALVYAIARRCERIIQSLSRLSPASDPTPPEEPVDVARPAAPARLFVVSSCGDSGRARRKIAS